MFFATPYRIFDTRGLSGVPLNNGAGNHPMNPTQIIPLQITGTVDPNDSSIVVPSGATGIIGNLIAITPAGEGFLGIQPSTGGANSRAWVNYEANVSIDNAVLVGLSSAGKIDIQCNTAKCRRGADHHRLHYLGSMNRGETMSLDSYAFASHAFASHAFASHAFASHAFASHAWGAHGRLAARARRAPGSHQPADLTTSRRQLRDASLA